MSPCNQLILSIKLLRGRTKRALVQAWVTLLIILVIGSRVFFNPVLNDKPSGWKRPLNIVSHIVGLSTANESDVPMFLMTQKKRLPNCIIIGVSKCGTRALANFLELHPLIVQPLEEVNYFDHPELQGRNGLNWYFQQMPPSYPYQITLEKSPDYFQTLEVPKLIHQTNKNVKLIVLFRDPVVRLVSEYMQLRDKHPGILPEFEDWAVNPRTGEVNANRTSVRTGKYSEHLQRWFDEFPPPQIHIVDGDSFTKDPLAELKAIETFLNIKPYFTEQDLQLNETKGFYCIRFRDTARLKCLGETKGRRHIEVDPHIKELLYQFYEPYNQILFRMLNRTMNWLTE